MTRGGLDGGGLSVPTVVSMSRRRLDVIVPALFVLIVILRLS